MYWINHFRPNNEDDVEYRSVPRAKRRTIMKQQHMRVFLTQSLCSHRHKPTGTHTTCSIDQLIDPQKSGVWEWSWEIKRLGIGKHTEEQRTEEMLLEYGTWEDSRQLLPNRLNKSFKATIASMSTRLPTIARSCEKSTSQYITPIQHYLHANRDAFALQMWSRPTRAPGPRHPKFSGYTTRYYSYIDKVTRFAKNSSKLRKKHIAINYAKSSWSSRKLRCGCVAVTMGTCTSNRA